MYFRLLSFLLPFTLVLGIIGVAAVAQEHGANAHAASAPSSLQAAISPDALLKDKEYQGVLTLTNSAVPVTLAGLEERHTQKIHLLVIDQSLGDYHHLHPVAGDAPGEYKFSFTPRTGHDYKIYADVKPFGGEAQMVPATLHGADRCKSDCVDRSAGDVGSAGHVAGRASFAQTPVTAGTPVDATVELKGVDGAALKDLEPVMGAYGHIVGFYADAAGVAHMHPSGAEPKVESDRGASPLHFMLHPDHAGYMKYFVQIRRGGKDVFLPFGVNIEK